MSAAWFARYRSLYKPLKPGQSVRIHGLFRSEPVVTVIGPLAACTAHIHTGGKYWQVRWPDGLVTEAARAHLSTKIVRETFVKKCP